ncbi:MAG TPA: chemotaxis protein CheW [Gemmatimonadaceae bacterium]
MLLSDGPTRLLVFGVGAERFAVPLSAVDEVIDAPELRPLPDASRAVLGVTLVRGVLVTIYDSRPLLNVEGGVDDAALLFVRNGRRVGLAVQALYDTIVAEQSDLRSAPGAGAGAGAGGSDKSLVGVIRRGSELIAVLDADALLDAAAAGEV